MRNPASNQPASTKRRRVFRWLAYGAVALVCLLMATAGIIYALLTRSLPKLDGRLKCPGLTAEVIIRRDALGTPDISARNLFDLARAIGYVHAQDRFFQMDQLRRVGSGELAELFGPAVLEVDKEHRLHGLRAVAAAVVRSLDTEHHRLLTAYTEGVNSGLTALRARPPEYFVLRQVPQPWREEDTLLVIYAMSFQLSNIEGWIERMKGIAHEALGEAAYEFYFPRGTEWDAALDGSVLPVPRMPTPQEFRAPPNDDGGTRDHAALKGGLQRTVLGSDGWVVDGAVSTNGAALIANDTHLGINSVPGVWYRLSLHWKEDGAGGGDRWAVGATIPGLPGLVIGSNGSIAWGYTAAHADVTDIINLELDPQNSGRYRTPDGWRNIGRREEHFRVTGSPAVSHQVETSIWGPLLPPEPGRPRQAVQSVLHDPDAMNLLFFDMMRQATITDALELAPRCGGPALNFLVGDREGHIGWTILGYLPRRVGFDGSVPTLSADGTRRWDGYVRPEDHPRRGSPEMHRIWSANQRKLAPDAVPYSGDDFVDLGARAKQIRDDLLLLQYATPADMLAIQTDNRALFLERWQNLLLKVARSMTEKPHDADITALLSEVENWGGRAATNSVGFRLVWQFRDEAIPLLLEPIINACNHKSTNYIYYIPQTEQAVWRLVTARPAHLLDRSFESYDALLETAATHVLTRLRESKGPLRERTWGELNYLRIQHPFSRVMPVLSRWLDLPGGPMPGDFGNMPSILNPTFGASQRLAVSPGHEADGYFHMPAGESGHFLSPYYRIGNREWREVKPLPLLAGTPEHTLTLHP